MPVALREAPSCPEACRRRRPCPCPIAAGTGAPRSFAPCLLRGFVPFPRSCRSPGPAAQGAFLSPSAADVGCPVTQVNKRSPKKYDRGLLCDSTDVHLYFICLPGVARCLALIGLAMLGEIFLFFPPDMIRFAETRSKRRGDTALNHCYWMSFLAVISQSSCLGCSVPGRGVLERSECPAAGIAPPATPGS